MSTPEGRRQKWTRLGIDYPTALRRYHLLEAARVSLGRDMPALISAYLASQDFDRKAKGTKGNYRIFARELSAAFRGVLPCDVTPADAQEILDRATRHPVKAQNMVAFMRTVLSWGAARRWLASNPLIGFRSGAKARRERYLTDDELARIEAHARPALKAFIKLAYVTALRRGDLVALKWSAVRGDVLHASIQKTRQAHPLRIGPDLKAVLDELKGLRGAVVSLYLLPGKHGKPPSASTYLHWFREAAKSAGVPDATIHDIRRKRLTDVTNTVGIEAARRLAGHTTQGMTERYYAGEHVVDVPAVGRGK